MWVGGRVLDYLVGHHRLCCDDIHHVQDATAARWATCDVDPFDRSHASVEK
jgi:hypothetical protein